LVIYGNKEIIFDPVTALERADSLIENVETELMRNVGHLPNIEQPEYIDQKLLQFLGSHESNDPN
jgi:pimeloyl-ACP methyl ester carboxylesterase